MHIPATPSAPSAAGTRTAAKVAAKKLVAKKAAAKKAPAAGKRAAAKQAGAAGKAPKAKAAVQAPAAPPQRAAASKPPKKPGKLRPQLVRDSFTMPETDFGLIAALKSKALDARRAAKKSELLRAGLHLLAGLEAKALAAALDKLEPVKIGRPKKGH